MSKSTLPPNLIIQLGRWGWNSLWHVMMSQLAPRNPAGEYLRPVSAFRQQVSAEAGAQYPPAAGRYRLIVGMGCPWAHRTLVVRSLKGLESAIPITRVSPQPEAGGWVFDEPFLLEPDSDTTAVCLSLAQLYRRAQPGYGGRSTVPVLWDSQTQTIVNNESNEIIVILNQAFDAVAQWPDRDLYPEPLRDEIDQWDAQIYPAINNGVYRCGFAQTQTAYDTAVDELFAALDAIDDVLATQRYLCGDRLTLADVRLFTTLVRFDVAYYGLFRCDRRRIADYVHLGGYLRDLYQHPGIAATCDIPAIKRDYYGNLFPLNPGGLIPAGPDIETWLRQPSQRAESSAPGSSKISPSQTLEC